MAASPVQCQLCPYWWRTGSRETGRCHNVFSESWNAVTVARFTCAVSSAEYDVSLDDRQEESCLIQR